MIVKESVLYRLRHVINIPQTVAAPVTSAFP